MPFSRASRDLGRGRWLPAALVFALVGAQGASFAHFALVKHAYCAEHGELVHPDAAPRGGATEHRSNGPGLYASEDEQHHGHDHCILNGHRREAVLASPTAAVIQVPDRSSDVEPRLLWAPSSTPRFRIAPKQSPPV
jgi:hypothetical protein